ncbi:hypothetical protein ACLI1A_00010 [Flavobacterium sp. RHBU_3]|uniref:hypothetical protein n=1 Tax=Flavobacterium sp. RHBU_3 TaxID=3391184 RepID=UPI0039854323
MTNKKPKVIPITVVLGIVCLIIFANIRAWNFDRELEKNGKVTIGKYVSRKNYPKTNDNFFIYFMKGLKYRVNGGRLPKEFSKNIGKFYKIKYSDKYVGVIRPMLNEEVTDTTEILKAGFSKEDLGKASD